MTDDFPGIPRRDFFEGICQIFDKSCRHFFKIFVGWEFSFGGGGSFTEILWCWSEIVSIYRRHYVAYLGVVRE